MAYTKLVSTSLDIQNSYTSYNPVQIWELPKVWKMRSQNYRSVTHVCWNPFAASIIAGFPSAFQPWNYFRTNICSPPPNFLFLLLCRFTWDLFYLQSVCSGSLLLCYVEREGMLRDQEILHVFHGFQREINVLVTFIARRVNINY